MDFSKYASLLVQNEIQSHWNHSQATLLTARKEDKIFYTCSTSVVPNKPIEPAHGP